MLGQLSASQVPAAARTLFLASTEVLQDAFEASCVIQAGRVG
jgi:hypothetical protein